MSDEQQPEIQVGQTWRRKRDGRLAEVMAVREKFVEIAVSGEWPVFPWTKTFLKSYEFVESGGEEWEE